MVIRSNIKAVSTLTIILLMIISAIIGGVISYIFTIASYIEIPEETTVAITGVFFDKENARSFQISVLNPSYSPTNATITRIALSLKGESQLYDIVETEPPIENGIVIPKSKSLNITCSKVRREGINIPWGKFAGEFAGETVTVHVFSSGSPAANMEATLPFVKLHIIDADFDSKVSFNRFNITVMNDANSEINLTINEIVIPVELMEISPELPCIIANGTSVHFTCTASWHNIIKATLTVHTEEGYVFSKELELPRVDTTIQNVIFDENNIDYFNVTVFNFAESANYVNVTKITCTLENGTTIERNYLSVGIAPNSTWTFTFNWPWKEYREKRINITAHLLQDFETDAFTATTPPPIIVKVLNEKEVFDLKDKEHFNITLQNHRSSLEAINITKIVVKETGEVINGTKADPPLPYGPIRPGQVTPPFCCNITSINWTKQAGGNLTLSIHALTNETLEEYAFEFVFTLPSAELNITSILPIESGGTNYLNITIQNLDYSVWNLTISKVRITLQNQTEPLEQTFPENQIIVKPGDKAILLCLFDWGKHRGESIIITVVTSEGIKASETFPVPESLP